ASPAEKKQVASVKVGGKPAPSSEESDDEEITADGEEE
ncbi:MAG: hypothetical protein ACD_47C00685G0003, partial [uncultured bacterium]